MLIAMALLVVLKVTPPELEVPPLTFKPYVVITSGVSALIGILNTIHKEPLELVYTGNVGPAGVLFIAAAPIISTLLWVLIRSLSREGFVLVPSFKIDLISLIASIFICTPILFKGFWVFVAATILAIAFALTPSEVQVPSVVIYPYAIVSSIIGLFTAVLLAFSESHIRGSLWISCDPLILLTLVLVSTALVPLFVLAYPYSKDKLTLVPSIRVDLPAIIITLGCMSPLLLKGLWSLFILTILFSFIEKLPRPIYLKPLQVGP